MFVWVRIEWKKKCAYKELDSEVTKRIKKEKEKEKTKNAVNRVA